MKKTLFIVLILIGGGFLVKCSQKNLLEPTTAQSYAQRSRVEGLAGIPLPKRINVDDSIHFGFKKFYYFTHPERPWKGEVGKFCLKNPNPVKPLRKVYLYLHQPEDINYGRCDNDWRIPHRIIQANHARISDTVWIPIEEQLEAYMMLDKYLFQEKNTREVQAAIAIYAEWLLKNEARETEITRQALVRLKGYWTGKQMREAEERLAQIHQLHVVELEKQKAENLRLGINPVKQKMEEAWRKRAAKLKAEQQKQE